jgi:hypothetical protein
VASARIFKSVAYFKLVLAILFNPDLSVDFMGVL